MATLPTDLRNKLERTCIAARNLAERAATDALQSLAVAHHEPYGHMTPEQRALRNKLRARARQLGDAQDTKGQLSITHLTQECAYEHWHRMLFARFLAENNLLIEPDMGVAVSLEECKELAKEAKTNLWALAGRYAQTMLPEIFRADDPVLQVPLAKEDQLKLEQLLDLLPADVFTASDSLGWCYQFWQTQRKKQVNDSGVKIGADELPSVTQLFTEDYMVDFLLDNTLGAWHAARCAEVQSSRFKVSSCPTEEAARKVCALPGVEWKYLRFIKVEAASSRLALEPKRLEGASTLKLGYLNPHADIENLSGNLPHWRQNQVTYFVTFRTADSLPQEKLRQWTTEKEAWLQQHPEPQDEQTRQAYYDQFPRRIQEWLDQGYGDCLLRKPELKARVADALKHFDRDRYHLDEFVVEANHVHVLVTPTVGHELADIVHSWKSFTANVINRETGQAGAFWQKESFDHIVRSPAQLEKIRSYIREHRGYDKVEAASSRVASEEVEAASSRLASDKVEAASSRLASDKVEAASSRLASEEKRQDAASTFWTPAAGTFDGWPKSARELKCLDPCMGSGHFVVAMFERLVALRMAEDKLDEAAAVAAVIRDNLFGLEIDPRCTQIGAFNLALAAWRRVGHRPLPAMNLACSGLAPNAKLEEWLKIVDEASSLISANQRQDAASTMRLRSGMERLYRLFQKAAVLGSLINPRAGEGDLLVAAFHELQPLLEKALKVEEASSLSSDQNKKSLEGSATLHELAVTARGLAKAAEILAGQFTLVATNVPYLGSGKQDEVLRDYCERVHPEAKADLASCFVERCLNFCAPESTAAILTPQNWLYLGPYKKVRERLLCTVEWNFVLWLGSKGFQTPMWDFNVVLVGLTQRAPTKTQEIAACDVSDEPTPAQKSAQIQSQEVRFLPQKRQLENPDARVLFAETSNIDPLGSYAGSFKGLATGDLARFIFSFWEVAAVTNGWRCLQGGVGNSTAYAGKEQIILWEDGRGKLFKYVAERLGETGTGAWLRGEPAWGHHGVAVAQISSLKATLFSGDLFDESTAAIIPKEPRNLAALWAYCSSDEFPKEVRKLDDSMKVPTLTLLKVPFDLAHWQKVAAEQYPHGLPKPFSSDPTQWLFNGQPSPKVDAASSRVSSDKRLEGASTFQSLHVAVARLLGYQWPRQTGSSFPDCPALGADGLEKFADADGIVCIPSVRGAELAADRLRKLLTVSFGEDWKEQTELELIRATGSDAADLEEWLRNDFFEQHCDLFHQRPFVWHIWDGRKRDGFHALVNYHKLAGEKGKGRRTLESLTHSYVGDWITRQKDGVKRGEEGAEERLAAALALKERLEAIINGEPPFDIFVRWKPFDQQAIGWEPDINDGVRMNIRPFLASDLQNGKKGAGILRSKPNIKWEKDRGNEPQRPKEDFPWFWKDGKFTGERVNDVHLTNDVKAKARKA